MVLLLFYSKSKINLFAFCIEMVFFCRNCLYSFPLHALNQEKYSNDWKSGYKDSCLLFMRLFVGIFIQRQQTLHHKYYLLTMFATSWQLQKRLIVEDDSTNIYRRLFIRIFSLQFHSILLIDKIYARTQAISMYVTMCI